MYQGADTLQKRSNWSLRGPRRGIVQLIGANTHDNAVLVE
jgi:hypothetical protein